MLKRFEFYIALMLLFVIAYFAIPSFQDSIVQNKRDVSELIEKGITAIIN